MYKRLEILVVCGVLISGCAGSPMRIASMTPEELRSVEESRLCSAYYYKSSENIASEITRRNLITETEWNSVKNRQISVGLKRCGVLAALGNPSMMMRKPIDGPKEMEALIFPIGTNTGYPTFKQRATTVYLVDGVVTKVDRN